jgi:transcriptional antiterminator RfaH
MAEARWLVCHTRPRCEKKLAALLVAEALEHYLPLVGSVRRYGARTKTFTKPLFPGYVFARVPAEKKTRLHQQDLLARAIAVEDEPAFLRQLADVRAIVASGLELCVMPLLTRGRRVRIVGGPLHGLEGFVLRQGLLVRVPAEHLRPLP